jgi:alpha,alpha-trehalase
LAVSRLSGYEKVRSPDQVFGSLYADVEHGHVFPDQKTFADAVPRFPVEKILADYIAAKREHPTGLDLHAFVEEHFLIPQTKSLRVPSGVPLEQHLTSLWSELRRDPDRLVPGSSLLPLPHPYIVPGGRFREIYYWDSYFSMLGLRESGNEKTIADMVDNFAYLIHTYGFIPNGNRSYYLSRSQPPFFALMVGLLAEKTGPQVYTKYLPALRAEHDFWSDRTVATRHLVWMPDNSRLTRYYDQRDDTRAEAFMHDEDVCHRSSESPAELYRNLRSTCESGWDFSTRWMADGRSLETVRTTNLVPVDLNCLLCQLERTLARAYREVGDLPASLEFAQAAERRRESVLKYCWSAEDRFFTDYDLAGKQPDRVLTLAGVVPLFVKLATPEQAAAVSAIVRERFLRPGGVVTTLTHSGQQWDAPNGWAPLEWMTIQGLENYGFHDLAAEIAHRWIALNTAVYRSTGKMMEKYDVEDVSRPSGGGEYPSQDGFGWTNGVLLKLLHTYGK